MPDPRHALPPPEGVPAPGAVTVTAIAVGDVPASLQIACTVTGPPTETAASGTDAVAISAIDPPPPTDAIETIDVTHVTVPVHVPGVTESWRLVLTLRLSALPGGTTPSTRMATGGRAETVTATESVRAPGSWQVAMS